MRVSDTLETERTVFRAGCPSHSRGSWFRGRICVDRVWQRPGILTQRTNVTSLSIDVACFLYLWQADLASPSLIPRHTNASRASIAPPSLDRRPKSWQQTIAASIPSTTSMHIPAPFVSVPLRSSTATARSRNRKHIERPCACLSCERASSICWLQSYVPSKERAFPGSPSPYSCGDTRHFGTTLTVTRGPRSRRSTCISRLRATEWTSHGHWAQRAIMVVATIKYVTHSPCLERPYGSGVGGHHCTGKRVTGADGSHDTLLSR